METKYILWNSVYVLNDMFRIVPEMIESFMFDILMVLVKLPALLSSHGLLAQLCLFGVIDV